MTVDGDGEGEDTAPDPERAASQKPTGDRAGEPARSRSGKDGKGGSRQRKQVLLRLDPAMYDALARWAADELRSTNAQIDYLLRQALKEAGRLPKEARPHPRRGRPPREG
ncbi:AT hook motif protein [Streptomyces smyrnaeus]|uniref:AT hook motif protein n=1 Tax=Streptomyces smyrnaeus TaxID=1387713 RepID=UPI00340A646E